MRWLPMPLVLIAAPAIAAGSFQDTVALDRSVAAFTGRAIGEDGGARSSVDARLKLAACPTVSISWRTPAHDAVVVTCTGPEWRVYVPVRMVANAAPVAAAAPAAGVRAAPVIKRGDPVMISAGDDGFSITRDGIAMGDASEGGRFMVRIDDVKAPIQAVALGTGRATLPGWSR